MRSKPITWNRHNHNFKTTTLDSLRSQAHSKRRCNQTHATQQQAHSESQKKLNFQRQDPAATRAPSEGSQESELEAERAPPSAGEINAELDYWEVGIAALRHIPPLWTYCNLLLPGSILQCCSFATVAPVVLDSANFSRICCRPATFVTRENLVAALTT